MSRQKSKTLAVWLAVLGGHLGLHRFYLRGLGDWIGWLHPIASALGWWGVERVRAFGQDDVLSWLLIPFLGMSIATSCLAGIVYALSDRPRWNGWFNPEAQVPEHSRRRHELADHRCADPEPAGGHDRLHGQPGLRHPALFRIPGRGSAQDQPVGWPTPRRAARVTPQGATPAARRSRFCGVLGQFPRSDRISSRMSSGASRH